MEIGRHPWSDLQGAIPLDDATIGKLGKLFIERRDVKAVQQKSGIYTPERTPFKMQDLRDHVEGRRTFGHYLLAPGNTCRLFAFDIDVRKSDNEPDANGEIQNPYVTWTNPDGEPEEFDARVAFSDPSHWARPQLILQANALAEGLARRVHRKLDIPVACAFSGAKGVHVYGFVDPLSSAATVRALAEKILTSFNCFEPHRGKNFWRHTDGYDAWDIEVFPKQVELNEDGFGNLMRLPLGVNRKTGAEGFFLRFYGGPTSEFKPFEVDRVVAGEVPWA